MGEGKKAESFDDGYRGSCEDAAEASECGWRRMFVVIVYQLGLRWTTRRYERVEGMQGVGGECAVAAWAACPVRGQILVNDRFRQN